MLVLAWLAPWARAELSLSPLPAERGQGNTVSLGDWRESATVPKRPIIRLIVGVSKSNLEF